MTFSKSVFAASSLLVMSAIVTSAQECSSDISQALIASIDNSSYFDTCAEGTTFNVTSAFDVLNFTNADMVTFCNSSTCLEPIHKNMKPLGCDIMYKGTLRNLSNEVSELHHMCHETLEAAEGSSHGKTGIDTDENAKTPGDSTTASSDASSIVLMMGSVISAAILAVFVA